jgi:3'(2'), 5'-bisphosphate nucleotidase
MFFWLVVARTRIAAAVSQGANSVASELDPRILLESVRDVARRAGDVILDIYNSDFEVRRKDDASPVTEADEAAERVILPELRALTPEIPIIAEEEVAAGRADTLSGECFWLVDPLDGTKEFIARNDEFTVNIALIRSGRPVLGVVFAPVLDHMYAGAGGGTASLQAGREDRRPIAVRAVPDDGAVMISSRSHGDPDSLAKLTAEIRVSGHRIAGSSLKFCLVAAGEADIYPRYGPTHEWDTAAGDAVLRAAGGSVRTLDGNDLVYGKKKFLNPQFIARGLD